MPQSEHHKHALSHLHNVMFYEDVKAGRVGVLTTENVKFAAMELTNIMLRERRISICKHMHSRDKKGVLSRLREQMGVYSFQYKQAINTFGRDRTSLSGKVGGAVFILICSNISKIRYLFTDFMGWKQG